MGTAGLQDDLQMNQVLSGRGAAAPLTVQATGASGPLRAPLPRPGNTVITE